MGFGAKRYRSSCNTLGYYPGYTANYTGAAPRLVSEYWNRNSAICWDSINPRWYLRDTDAFRGRWDPNFMDLGDSLRIENVTGSDPNVFHLRGHSSTLTKYWRTYDGALFASSEVPASRNMSQRVPDRIFLHSIQSGLPPLGATYGPTAIARTRPTDPSVSVAQSLGELKEGLPTPQNILQQRGTIRKLAAGNLTWEFGVKPLLSDIEAYREAYQNSAKILEQWRRDSGRRVRRRYRFPQDVWSETTVKTSVRPWNMADNDLTRPGTLTKTIESVADVWFSGAYRYFIPPLAEGWLRDMQDFDRVYGVVPDVATAWELVPFSWLVDWQTNAGDVIANIAALGSDQCFLQYGYLMRHSRVKVTWKWSGDLRINHSWVPSEITDEVYFTLKERTEAKPFAVAFTGDEFSTRQLGILASLGVIFTK